MKNNRKLYLTSSEKEKYGLTQFPLFNIESEFFRVAYSTMIVTNELIFESNEEKINLYVESLKRLIECMKSYYDHFDKFLSYNDVESEENYLKFIKRVQSFSNVIEECKKNNNHDKISEYYERILDYYELLKIPVEYIELNILKDED